MMVLTILLRSVGVMVGLTLILATTPLYVSEVRKVFRGPEYVPGNLAASALGLALGLALLGVTLWLSWTS